MRVERLRIGELVADANGTIGKVVYFTRDHAVIEWDGAEQPARYSDDGLKKCGVVRVEGQ